MSTIGEALRCTAEACARGEIVRVLDGPGDQSVVHGYVEKVSWQL